MKIYRKNTIVQIDKDDGTRVFLNPPFCRLRKFEDIYEVHDSQKLERHLLGNWDVVEDEYGNTFATAQDFENYITGFINFSTGGRVGFLSGIVDIYSNLPPAIDHNGEFWLVDVSSGGYLSWLGVYKYPKGVYSPNTSGVWELVPINVRTAEDSLTLVNITDWSEFYAFVTDINIGDRITYQQKIYKNLNGAITTSAPDVDTANWVGYNDFTDGYKTQVDDNTLARHTHPNKSTLDKLPVYDAFMYVTNNATITPLTQNLWSKFVATYSTFFLNGFTHSAGTLTYTQTRAITAIINIAINGYINNRECEIAIFKNGVIYNTVIISAFFGKVDELSNVPFVVPIDLVQNDYIELYIRNIENNDDAGLVNLQLHLKERLT